MDQITQSAEQNKFSAFWKNHLLDYCSLSLPQKETYYPHNTKAFRWIRFQFETSESQSMHEFSKRSNSNLFNFLYLGLIQSLAELTHKDDIGITTFVHSPDPSLLSLKCAPLLVRYRLNSSLSFCEQFNQASLAVFQAYEYRNSNLELLLAELQLSSPELFQISVSVVDAQNRNMIYLPCKEVAEIPFPYHSKKAEISFALQYTEEGIQGDLCYNENRYEGEFIQTLMNLFQQNLRKNLQHFK